MTHILKQTGSYEQASYAIQDTPDMVAQHYGRFLPQDKAALAAAVLNRAWEAAGWQAGRRIRAGRSRYARSSRLSAWVYAHGVASRLLTSPAGQQAQR